MQDGVDSLICHEAENHQANCCVEDVVEWVEFARQTNHPILVELVRAHK